MTPLDNSRLLFVVFVSYVLGVIVGAAPKPFHFIYAFISIGIAVYWVRRARASLPLLVVAVACGLLGGLRANVKLERPVPAGEPWRGVPDGAHIYEGRVESHPIRVQAGRQARVTVSRWKNDLTWVPIHAVSQLRFRGEAFPVRGQTIRFKGRLRSPRNLGNRFEYDSELAFNVRGVDLVGTVSAETGWVEVAPAGTIDATLSEMREKVRDHASRFMSAAGFPIFESLIFGELGGVTSDVIRNFRRTGVIHLLVVSGFHFAVLIAVLGMLGGLLFRFRVRNLQYVSIWWVRIAFGAIGALFYMNFIDPPLPASRAFLFVLIAVLVAITGRTIGLFRLTIFVAFVLLVSQPLLLFHPSFQLSFAAVFGVFCGVQWMKRFFSIPGSTLHGRILKWTLECVVITIGATLATLPIVVWHFHQFSLVSIFGNLIAGPALGVVAVPIGFFASILISLSVSLGDYLLCALDTIINAVLPLLEWLSDLQYANIVVSRPQAETLALIYSIGLIAYFERDLLKTMKFKVTATAALVIAAALGCFGCWRSFEFRTDGVDFLSVGQGDATVLRLASGSAALIDAGPGGSYSYDAGERIILPWLFAHGITKLNLLVFTHADMDHVGGALAIMNEIPIMEIWSGPTDAQSIWERLQMEARKRNIPWITFPTVLPDRREKVPFDFEVLYPLLSSELSDANDNDRSLVLRARLGSESIFLPGDLERNGERELIRTVGREWTKLFKVPHHGSSTSTTDELLEFLAPTDAFISSGWKNIYRHPSEKVLERLRRRGIRIWRTDLCGQISASFQAHRMEISSVFPCGITL